MNRNGSRKKPSTDTIGFYNLKTDISKHHNINISGWSLKKNNNYFWTIIDQKRIPKLTLTC